MDSIDSLTQQLSDLCEVRCSIKFKKKRSRQELPTASLAAIAALLQASGADLDGDDPNSWLGKKVSLPEMQDVLSRALAEAVLAPEETDSVSTADGP
jgi:hypothetical protein